MVSLIALPLFSVFVGIAAVLIPISVVMCSDVKRSFCKEACASIFDQVDFVTLLGKKFDNDVFDAEVETLLDNKLNDLVLVFKKQIPMASTFLVGEIVVKLKKSAKSEFLKVMPEMKERLLVRLRKDAELEVLCFEKMADTDFTWAKKYVIQYCLAGGGVGFILGVAAQMLLSFGVTV